MNPRIYEKLKQLQNLTEERSQDNKAKNKLKADTAKSLNNLLLSFEDNIFGAQVRPDRQSRSFIQNAPFFLAIMNPSSPTKENMSAKQIVINEIKELEKSLNELKNKVLRQGGSKETKEMIEQSENLVKDLKKEYVVKFEAYLNSTAPKYIPKPPQVVITQQGLDMVEEQKRRLSTKSIAQALSPNKPGELIKPSKPSVKKEDKKSVNKQAVNPEKKQSKKDVDVKEEKTTEDNTLLTIRKGIV